MCMQDMQVCFSCCATSRQVLARQPDYYLEGKVGDFILSFFIEDGGNIW